jgi:hypothetical protein
MGAWTLGALRSCRFFMCGTPIARIMLTCPAMSHLRGHETATGRDMERGNPRRGETRASSYTITIPEDRCIGTTGEALRIGGMLSFLTTACRADEVIQALA